MKMELAVAEGHLCNMGRMIEELEGKLRNSLDQVLPPIPAPIPVSSYLCKIPTDLHCNHSGCLNYLIPFAKLVTE